jgi:hypothetical protein
VCVSHAYDEADGEHPGRGHDFGTVGDEVEKDGHDGLRSMVKLVPQHHRQVAKHTQKDESQYGIWEQMCFITISVSTLFHNEMHMHLLPNIFIC